MANTQVNNICFICEKRLQAGKAMFIGMVELTKTTTSALFNREIQDGKYRIKHLVGGKPRGAVHIECLQEKLK